MKQPRLVVLTLLIAVISLPQWVLAQDPVARSVPLEGEITRIYLNGAVELHLTQGDEQYVKLTTTPEQLARIPARVKGRSLYLGREFGTMDGDFLVNGTSDSVRFDVQLSRIDAVRVRGSGHAYVGNIVSRRLRFIMWGSGNIEMESVHTDNLRIEVAGSGELNARQIIARDMGIEVTGSTTMHLDEVTTSELEIEIAGSADIDIAKLQTADLETEISGSGQLNLAGKATSQDLEFNGSADYNTADLISDYVYMEIRGPGDVVVAVEKELTAEISGGGDLEYYAGQDLFADISGHGKSRRVGDIRKNE